MQIDDPISTRRRQRWDMLKAQNPTMPDDDITARVLQDIPDPEPVPDAGPQGAEYFKGLGRQALQGATFEFGDEAEAALRTGSVSSPEYKSTRDRIREQNARFQQTNKKASFAANMAGGAVVPGLGGAATVAKVAGKPLLKAGVGAALGGLAGSATGAGVAPEMEDVPVSAALGGVIGAGVGGVLAPVGGMLFRGLADSKLGQVAGNKVGEVVAGASAGASKLLNAPKVAQAGAAVQKGLNYDERMKKRAMELVAARLAVSHTPETATTAIQEAFDKFGVQLTLPDLSGNVSGLARSAANRVGKSRDGIPEFYAERQEMMPLDAPQKIPVLTNTPNASTPKNVRAQSMSESITDRSRPNYREAYADGEIMPSTDFVRTMESPMVRDAYNTMRANELALRDAGQQYRPISTNLYDAQGRLRKNPNVADLDGLKQHIDDELERFRSEIEQFGMPSLGAEKKGRYHALEALRKRIIQEGDDKLPQTVTLGNEEVNKWAFARAKHAEMSRPRDLYTEGTGFMRMSADQLRDFAQRAQTDPEVYEAAQEGVLKAVIELTENTAANGMNNPMRAAMHPVRKQFLKSFLPADKAEKLLGYGDLLKKQTKTAGDVLRNSTTARQLFDDADATGQANMTDKIAKGVAFATGGLAQKARTASDFVRGLDAGINEKTSEYLNDYLTRSGPRGVDLIKELNTSMQRRLNARGAGNVLAGSAAGRFFGGQ